MNKYIIWILACIACAVLISFLFSIATPEQLCWGFIITLLSGLLFIIYDGHKQAKKYKNMIK